MKLILLRHEKRENYPGFFSNLVENGFKGNLKRLGLPDSYVQHGSRSQILSHLSLDDSGIKTKVLELIDEVKELH